MLRTTGYGEHAAAIAAQYESRAFERIDRALSSRASSFLPLSESEDAQGSVGVHWVFLTLRKVADQPWSARAA